MVNQAVAKIADDRLKLVVGLGATGLSVARFLATRGERFAMLDTRQSPPQLDNFRKSFSDIPLELGPLQQDSLLLADEIILSPGLPLSEPTISAAREQGVAVIGDIELFARHANAPVIAITGSNGKSTVTTLVGEMCLAAGMNAGIGGNLGTPALDLLADDRDIYVLELSSFQLELVDKLHAAVAVVLNVTPDHMDRYASMIQYHQAKHRIFRGAKHVVVNRDDPLSHPLLAEGVNGTFYGLGQPDLKDFGTLQKDGQRWICQGVSPLMPVSELAIRGRHNLSNALAALALGSAVNLPMATMLEVLRKFQGLPHRCQTVATLNGVGYINDSKATNVGATVAAIEGLGEDNNLILLAGGQGKGQNFAELADAARGKVRSAVLFGEDADKVAESLQTVTQVIRTATLAEALKAVQPMVQSGDVVLLSPACASLDQFRNFEDRGDTFVELVEALPEATS